MTVISARNGMIDEPGSYYICTETLPRCYVIQKVSAKNIQNVCESLGGLQTPASDVGNLNSNLHTTTCGHHQPVVNDSNGGGGYKADISSGRLSCMPPLPLPWWFGPECEQHFNDKYGDITGRVEVEVCFNHDVTSEHHYGASSIDCLQSAAAMAAASVTMPMGGSGSGGGGGGGGNDSSLSSPHIINYNVMSPVVDDYGSGGPFEQHQHLSPTASDQQIQLQIDSNGVVTAGQMGPSTDTSLISSDIFDGGNNNGIAQQQQQQQQQCENGLSNSNNNYNVSVVGSNTTLPFEELKKQLKAQLEWYFSRENLAGDTYLRSQMDNDQFVPIRIVANFNMVKKMTSDFDLIVQLYRESPLVQVDEKGEKVRPVHKRCTLILREIPEGTEQKEVEELFNSPECPKIVSCEYAQNNFWYINFESDEHAQSAYMYLQQEVATFKGKPIKARIKTAPIPRVQTVTTSHGYRPVPPSTLPLLNSPQYSGGVTPVSAVTGSMMSPVESLPPPSSSSANGFVSPAENAAAATVATVPQSSASSSTAAVQQQSSSLLFIPASPVAVASTSSGGAARSATAVPQAAATLVASPVIPPPWALNPASFVDSSIFDQILRDFHPQGIFRPSVHLLVPTAHIPPPPQPPVSSHHHHHYYYSERGRNKRGGGGGYYGNPSDRSSTSSMESGRPPPPQPPPPVSNHRSSYGNGGPNGGGRGGSGGPPASGGDNCRNGWYDNNSRTNYYRNDQNIHYNSLRSRQNLRGGGPGGRGRGGYRDSHFSSADYWSSKDSNCTKERKQPSTGGGGSGGPSTAGGSTAASAVAASSASNEKRNDFDFQPSSFPPLPTPKSTAESAGDERDRTLVVGRSESESTNSNTVSLSSSAATLTPSAVAAAGADANSCSPPRSQKSIPTTPHSLNDAAANARQTTASRGAQTTTDQTPRWQRAKSDTSSLDAAPAAAAPAAICNKGNNSQGRDTQKSAAAAAASPPKSQRVTTCDKATATDSPERKLDDDRCDRNVPYSSPTSRTRSQKTTQTQKSSDESISDQTSKSSSSKLSYAGAVVAKHTVSVGFSCDKNVSANSSQQSVKENSNSSTGNSMVNGSAGGGQQTLLQRKYSNPSAAVDRRNNFRGGDFSTKESPKYGSSVRKQQPPAPKPYRRDAGNHRASSPTSSG